ncbi:glucose kinase [Leptospira kobayashii]|uniref:Glucose kinase n=1 Tax=Leptospira kobayashii TaxID=1917830 RepID=A0ABN6KC32_9LEPT|nr:ROK family protein [Leptospira kobayashii]BDA78523.1 glucose kinase [Leptospira kobayashii]
MKEDLAIGVDIGGGSVKAGLFNRLGEELDKSVLQTSGELSNARFLEIVQNTISPLLKEKNIRGIGIGSPGPLDSETGYLLSSANFPLLKNVPISKTVRDRFSLPVYYENDANCAALGESYFGESKSYESLLVLTLGTGIGGGFVDKGKLFSGYKGNGIEIGHMTSVIDGAICGCGQKGCVESYFSTRGFINRYAEKTNNRLTNAADFFDLVKAGDKDAKEILRFGILCLAETVRNAIHLLNPEGVVFVGGITESWDQFGEDLSHKIRARIFPVLNERLKIKRGKNLAGSLGAASLVFSHGMRGPE